MFKNKYRIVTDAYCGFECQKKLWWSPFWFQMGGLCNSHTTLDEAKMYIENDAKVIAEFTPD